MTDARIEDESISEEIDLLSEVMIAASQRDSPLPTAQLDSVLGLSPQRLAVGC